MNAFIEYLKDKLGNVILPVTSTKCVLNDDGKNVEELIDEIDAENIAYGDSNVKDALDRLKWKYLEAVPTSSTKATINFDVKNGDWSEMIIYPVWLEESANLYDLVFPTFTITKEMYKHKTCGYLYLTSVNSGGIGTNFYDRVVVYVSDDKITMQVIIRNGADKTNTNKAKLVVTYR